MAVQPHGVHLIHEGQRPVLVGHVAQLIGRADGACNQRYRALVFHAQSTAKVISVHQHRRRNVAAQVAEELQTVTYTTPLMEERREKK